MKRPIALSLSPNTQPDDVWCALKVMASPWMWKDSRSVVKLEKKFSEYLGQGSTSRGVNAGRSALLLALRALDISKGDEVIVQSFSCVAVANAVHWVEATPIFADTDETLNISYKDIKDKMTSRTKAIVVQHTFGIPADMKQILKLARSKNIAVIEDCAHALGATYGGQKVGTLGDISVFSFGRDKVISSVFGGMIATRDPKLGKKINLLCDSLTVNSYAWIAQQLLHPILFNALILPLYDFGWGKYGVGKIILFVSQKMHILSKPVYPIELSTSQPQVFPKRLSGALAALALLQISKLDRFNAQRKEHAAQYLKKLKTKVVVLPSPDKEAIWLRFPIRVKNPQALYSYARSKGILLGDWYSNVIDPKCDLAKVGYLRGENSHSESASSQIVNLPTYPTLTNEEREKVIDTVNAWQNTQ